MSSTLWRGFGVFRSKRTVDRSEHRMNRMTAASALLNGVFGAGACIWETSQNYMSATWGRERCLRADFPAEHRDRSLRKHKRLCARGEVLRDRRIVRVGMAVRTVGLPHVLLAPEGDHIDWPAE